MSEPLQPDPRALQLLLEAVMPYGKYKGRRLLDLPGAYLVWLARTGFPAGRLGEQLRQVYELEQNGLRGLLRPPLRAPSRPPGRPR